MTDTTVQHHPDDGDLVRLLDRELPAPAAAAIRAHLDGCDDCARRWQRLARRSDALGRLLDASGEALVPPAEDRTEGADGPGRRPRRPGRTRRGGRTSAGQRGSGPLGLRVPRWWRVAAAIALVLGVGLLAPPVRAWVADRIDAVRQWTGDDPAAAPPAGGATVLRLAASGPRLVVEATDPGRGTVLVVERTGGTEAVLEVASPGASVVVIAGGFRLEGGEAGREIVLAVPAVVDSLVLRTDGDAPTTLAVPPTGLRIPLAPPE